MTPLRQRIFKEIQRINNITFRSASYKAIVRRFPEENPETISRTIREMVVDGALVSPFNGKFYASDRVRINSLVRYE